VDEFNNFAVRLISTFNPGTKDRQHYIDNVIRIIFGAAIEEGENKKVDEFRKKVNIMRIKTDGDKQKVKKMIEGMNKR
jgi:hypothetical protein